MNELLRDTTVLFRSGMALEFKVRLDKYGTPLYNVAVGQGDLPNVNFQTSRGLVILKAPDIIGIIFDEDTEKPEKLSS